MSTLRYYMIYKPYGVLSQFSGEDRYETLAGLWDFPKDVYPIGRLDKDSEGLLLISNDKRLNHKLLDPKFEHEREYWVQVEGKLEEAHLIALQSRPIIRINKKEHRCKVAKASPLITDLLPERDPPVRFRRHIPTSWLSLCLTEGKNRQVRRMTAKVGIPTLRLFRYRIQDLVLKARNPGYVEELEQETLSKLLRIRL